MEENYLSDMQFKVMVIRMFNSMNKEINTIKKDESKMKNTTSEMKNTLRGINSRLN